MQFEPCENHLQPVLDEETDGDVLSICKPLIGETDAHMCRQVEQLVLSCYNHQGVAAAQ